MVADLFAPYADRIVPVGVLSLAEPDRGDRPARPRGLAGPQGARHRRHGRPRTIDEDADWQPEPASGASYIDGLGLDSPYDYDPVWQRFVDLGIPVDEPQRQHGLARSQPAVELRRQPPRPLRPEPPHVRPQPVPRWRHRAVPRHSTSGSSRGRGVGVQPVRRPASATGRSATGGSWTSTSSPRTSTSTSCATCSCSTPRATPASTARSTTSSPATSTALESDISQEELTRRDLDDDEFAARAHRRPRRHPATLRPQLLLRL